MVRFPKDNDSQLTAIEGAVKIEDGLTECFHDLLARPVYPARHNITGQFVGIDDHRAALLEHLGNGAFAGGDAACEAD